MTNDVNLLQRRNDALPRGIRTSTPIFAARALNAELWDADGRRYLDFTAGIAVLNVGHCHPRVIEAARSQLDAFTHTAFQVIAYESYVALAERLNALAPISGETKTVLFSTGAEAVENAIKISRKATGRSAVIAFSGGFHGRSYMAMALTGKTDPYKRGFGPMPGGVFHVPFPVSHHGTEVEDTLKALDHVFKADIAAEEVAAIIIEPVQGEGGFHVAPPELMKALRKICDEHGIILIADEVQCGFARTGKMFGIEHSSIEPDLITVAKSLAGGLPLSGVIGRATVMDAVDPGGLGGTYAGSPVACAAALAVLDVIDDEKLCERARVLGESVTEKLHAFAAREDLKPIGQIRSLGSMIAFDLLLKRGRDEPDSDGIEALIERARDLGLILLRCGSHGEAIRMLYPLTISDDVLAEGMAMLEKALATG